MFQSTDNMYNLLIVRYSLAPQTGIELPGCSVPTKQSAATSCQCKHANGTVH